MICLNEFSKLERVPREAAETFVLLLSPFAPHIGEELWEMLDHKESLAYHPWPEWDEALLKVDEVEILVQVLGKPKARLMMPVGVAQADAEKSRLPTKTSRRRSPERRSARSSSSPGGC